MSVAKKFAVSGVFLLGALEISTGVARLVVYINQSKDMLKRELWITITYFKKNTDGIGHLTTLMVWSFIETSNAVIAGCLPTIWPLFDKMSLESMVQTLRSVLSFDSLRGSTKSAKNNTGSHDYHEQKDSVLVSNKQTG
ncbi:hypothetical protein F5B18DRAFT_653550 [Nemania serpens]|nr:hypothetical protein F5B18DRAFT_653550 [Nemania serpens]